jgi:hypothetical protein
MMSAAWPKRIVFGHADRACGNGCKTASEKTKSEKVLADGSGRKCFVSAWAMREYANRRGSRGVSQRSVGRTSVGRILAVKR